jgi:hypothetical protein
MEELVARLLQVTSGCLLPHSRSEARLKLVQGLI